MNSKAPSFRRRSEDDLKDYRLGYKAGVKNLLEELLAEGLLVNEDEELIEDVVQRLTFAADWVIE